MISSHVKTNANLVKRPAHAFFFERAHPRERVSLIAFDQGSIDIQDDAAKVAMHKSNKQQVPHPAEKQMSESLARQQGRRT